MGPRGLASGVLAARPWAFGAAESVADLIDPTRRDTDRRWVVTGMVLGYTSSQPTGSRCCG